MQYLFLRLLVGTSSLLLIGSPEFLAPVLPLFPLLSRWFLDLVRNANTHLSVVWLAISNLKTEDIPQTS